MPFLGIHRLRRHACLGSTPASEAGSLRRHADDAFRRKGTESNRRNEQEQRTLAPLVDGAHFTRQLAP